MGISLPDLGDLMPNYAFEITERGLDRLNHLESLARDRSLSPSMVDEQAALSTLIDGPLEIPERSLHFHELVYLYHRLERRGYVRRSTLHQIDPSQDRRVGPQITSGKFERYDVRESRKVNPPSRNGRRPERPELDLDIGDFLGL